MGGWRNGSALDSSDVFRVPLEVIVTPKGYQFKSGVPHFYPSIHFFLNCKFSKSRVS
jgi:hypothetical protein